MKKLILLLLLLMMVPFIKAQFLERIIPRYGDWPDGAEGISCLELQDLNVDISWPSELKDWQGINIFDVPFKVDQSSVYGTGYEETDTISLAVPENTKEVLLLLYSSFSTTEKIGFEGLVMPLDVLDQPERIFFELEYDDGSIEKLIPINADKQIYGVCRGRGLYSLKAPVGKSIVGFSFADKMTNASFLFAGITVNSKLARIPNPQLQSAWYPEVRKVKKSEVEFNFQKDRGLSWGMIRSEMLPGDIDLTESPVFRMVINENEIPSTEWDIISVEENKNSAIYSLEYRHAEINLAAQLFAEKTMMNEIQLRLSVANQNQDPVTGTLYFPVIEGIAIDNVDETWYAYARDGLVLNKVPCSWRDYIGSEKPMQYDGIFNPSRGVGIAFLPRDLTDEFRWYNLSKDESGINYSLEFPPQEVHHGETFRSVSWACAIIPGDWKDQYNVYREWLQTWYKPLVPRLDWFQDVFAFVIDNAYATKNPDFVAHAQEFKERWGVLDYYHIWGWSYTGGSMQEGSWWGDYSHFENVGGKKQLQKTVQTFQEKMNVPFALYVDAYLMSVNASEVPDSLKIKWSIKNAEGESIKPYASYAMCPYVEEWRNYLKNIYLRLEKDFGLKGIYNDETGMYMRSRACYDKNHGHPVPYYQAGSELSMLKELKTALPEVAIYTELGATDVMCQYADGSFGYTTFWGAYTPRGWGNFDAHQSYNSVAPHYLHLRRFACPDFKTFELNMFETPWRNGNWYIAKFPFFNGNSYYHRYDDGVDADQEAVELFQKIRTLQEKYKPEFSSMDVEPLITTECRDIFINRFSSEENDIFTVYNAGFRTQNDLMVILDNIEGAHFKNEWSEGEIHCMDLPDHKVGLSFEIGPRSVFCFSRHKMSHPGKQNKQQ